MNRELNLEAKTIHEAIEAQAAREGYKPKPAQPLTIPVLALPHTAIYKMHRYYARRPHNVFAKIIQQYTNPGDLVLDPFCGGGVTVVESLKLRRRVIGVDTNPLATWITSVEVEGVDFGALESCFNEWYGAFENDINDLYKAKCSKCGKFGLAEWYEWSNVVVCPICEKEVVLGAAKKLRAGVFECSTKTCKANINPNKCEKKPDTMLSVMVDCDKCGKKVVRKASPDDIKRYNQIVLNEKAIIRKNKLKIPNDKFPDMDRARDDNIFGKGVKYFKDLMTKRQSIGQAMMIKSLKNLDCDNKTLNAILMIMSSTLRFTNKMVMKNIAWRGQKPLEWPGHNYWMPYSYLEANPLFPLKNRYRALKSGKLEQEKAIGNFSLFPKTRKPWEELENGATCLILNQSSHSLNLPNEFVDAIITDPPFGGNVQYGELSDFYLVWLREFLGLENLSNKEFEAIETRNQGFDGAKDREFYEEMLFSVFKECRRILKPDGWLVLTFHNRDVGVWMSLNRAAIRAGFRLPGAEECSNRGMVYQPPIENYTQTIHQRMTGSMLGDFILSFRPKDQPIQLESIKAQLSTDEEKLLTEKTIEIIKYHGGADETTMMTALLPYLSEKGLLARLARFDIRLFLENGPFTYLKSEKKWYTKDMVEESGTLKPIDLIKAESLTQELVFSYLSEKKQATLDELLQIIYSNLVNAHRPQMSTIANVLNKYCRKIKTKASKRELYVWNPQSKTPEQIATSLVTQTNLLLESTTLDHNEIIAKIGNKALAKEFQIHIGLTEQKKSEKMAALSVSLSGLELGFSAEVFKTIREIDLIILQGNNISAALEVATTISTFNKAINDRFRNLLVIAPNLNIRLGVIVIGADYDKAYAELNSPANKRDELPQKIKLWKTTDLDSIDFSRWLFE